MVKLFVCAQVSVFKSRKEACVLLLLLNINSWLQNNHFYHKWGNKNNFWSETPHFQAWEKHPTLHLPLEQKIAHTRCYRTPPRFILIALVPYRSRVDWEWRDAANSCTWINSALALSHKTRIFLAHPWFHPRYSISGQFFGCNSRSITLTRGAPFIFHSQNMSSSLCNRLDHFKYRNELKG